MTSPDSSPSLGLVPKLTKAEQEVLNIIKEGIISTKEISIRRKTTQRNIQKIIQNIKKKGVLDLNFNIISNIITNDLKQFKKSKRREIESKNSLYDNLIGELDRRCYFCDEHESLQIHHIIRKRDGGTNERNNLITLCANCHLKIHKHRYYVNFSNGFYTMRNELNESISINPSKRQHIIPRECPNNSISIAINKGKLYIEK